MYRTTVDEVTWLGQQYTADDGQRLTFPSVSNHRCIFRTQVTLVIEAQ